MRKLWTQRAKFSYHAGEQLSVYLCLVYISCWIFSLSISHAMARSCGQRMRGRQCFSSAPSASASFAVSFVLLNVPKYVITNLSRCCFRHTWSVNT